MKRTIIDCMTFRKSVDSQNLSKINEPYVAAEFDTAISISEDGTATFNITSSVVDRQQDIIVPEGIQIGGFLKTPVVLWNHEADRPPIGKCIELTRINDGLLGTVKFEDETTPYIGPLAACVRKQLSNGTLSAVSLTIRPLEFDLNEFGGVTVTKSELLEFSVVTVPANQTALVIERPKEKAIGDNTVSKSMEEKEDDIEKDIDDDIEGMKEEERFINAVEEIITDEKDVQSEDEELMEKTLKRQKARARRLAIARLGA
ncbi:peptidase U35 phage prohead HK97 [Acetobacter orientalis]|uniref:Peptidase U35 phage prohead HK97 n=1 Tax=Acetobacter orientalis TaxID=146474 RepID=A0A2Z5ZHP2_9PROT|nr:peptidase U35 phage prohead HK97 [Acetobacter orientalis]